MAWVLNLYFSNINSYYQTNTVLPHYVQTRHSGQGFLYVLSIFSFLFSNEDASIAK